MSIPMAALQQQLLSFQLLQYHILMPSLLISKNASMCEGCPTYIENMRTAALSNHLAIDHLSHMVIGYLRELQPMPVPVPGDPTGVCADEGKACKPGTLINTTPEPTATAATTTVEPTGPGTEEAELLSYVTSIQVTNHYNTKLHLCGGTLISPSWVLTAAHCLDAERPETLVVVAGEKDIGNLTGQDKNILVAEFHKHPNYTYYKKPYEHDLGLIRLAEPVNESIASIAQLPDTPFDDFTALCQEPGWGPLRDNAPGSNVLKVASVPIVEKEACNAAYFAKLGEGSICAGKAGVGACVGDNGGPLICNSKLVAVMSWREGCAQPGKPAVYMDIAAYLPWIRKITKIGQ